MGFLGTAEAATHRCLWRSAGRRENTFRRIDALLDSVTLQACPLHAVGWAALGCPSRSTGHRAVSGPPDLLSGRDVAVHLQSCKIYVATWNELCHGQPPAAWFQANQRILDNAAVRLGVPPARVISNLAEYGCTWVCRVVTWPGACSGKPAHPGQRGGAAGRAAGARHQQPGRVRLHLGVPSGDVAWCLFRRTSASWTTRRCGWACRRRASSATWPSTAAPGCAEW